MRYVEYLPAQQLRPYIDAYWVLETDSLFTPLKRRIVADGCTEIFVNMGSSIPTINAEIALRPGTSYLGGTMTRASIVSSLPNTNFVGIRFKPAGFPTFYRLPLTDIVDEIIEFPEEALMKEIDMDESLPGRLDQFFIRKMNPAFSQMTSLVETVGRYGGIISVDLLAEKHHLTTRTLERYFKREIGITPKLFISIVKFTHLNKRIRANNMEDSLLHIAYEMGYYDHSHLTRAFKKFSGLSPSEIGRLPM
jgi:AraC-like DNA-binding protein